MNFEPEPHYRRSIRLKGYDCSQSGAYFITVCIKNRECLLGKVVNGEMRVNEAGNMVQRVWDALARRFPAVDLDAFVVMPNHIHGIILVGAGLALPSSDKRGAANANTGAASSAHTVGDVMRAFKSISAINVNRILRRMGQPFWQRNYYEHIVE